jgi:hypothetical protein
MLLAMLPIAELVPRIPDTALALFISMAAIIFAARRWRSNVLKKRRQAEGSPISPRLPTAPTQNSLSVREVTMEVHALVADLEETSRRAAAQIQNRCAKLEILIAEADEKIRTLTALTSGTTPTIPPPEIATPPSSNAAQLLGRLRQERGAPEPEEDPVYKGIYALADQGRSAREIGQELGRQPGEIELILALRRRQHAS